MVFKRTTKKIVRKGFNVIVGTVFVGVIGDVGRGVPLIRPIQDLSALGVLKQTLKK